MQLDISCPFHSNPDKSQSNPMKINTDQHTNHLNSSLVREQLHKMLCDLPEDEFTFFHLTTTYLPYQDRTYASKDLNKFFINFYLKTLLPELFHTRRCSKKTKSMQPLVLSFLDEHESKPVVVRTDHANQPIYAFPVRLHHHSIIASRPSTTEQFQSLVGDNTMLRYSGKMMTSNLVQCDADRMFYASKMLWKYPNDYLMFGFQDRKSL
jgi:hypothetical protein